MAKFAGDEPVADPKIFRSIRGQLDHYAAAPLYYQLAQALRKALQAGDITDRRRLEPKLFLARELGVRPPTLRKALELLDDWCAQPPA